MHHRVVDIRAQRVAGNPALLIENIAGHFSTAQPARALHHDALGTQTHCALRGLLHRALERHALGDLLANALRDELGVQLRLMDLADVELDLFARQLLQLATEHVDVGAALADDHTRLGRVDRHLNLVRSSLDLDA